MTKIVQSLTKLLSRLEQHEIVVPPCPHVNVVLKKVPNQDDTRHSATVCGAATLTRGRGETEAKKLNIWGWLSLIRVESRHNYFKKLATIQNLKNVELVIGEKYQLDISSRHENIVNPLDHPIFSKEKELGP